MVKGGGGWWRVVKGGEGVVYVLMESYLISLLEIHLSSLLSNFCTISTERCSAF